MILKNSSQTLLAGGNLNGIYFYSTIEGNSEGIKRKKIKIKNKRCLFLGRKAMTNLDITLLTKDCIIRAMVFPVVMYGCESWTIKKAEHQSIDAIELWCWGRLLRVPWIARKSIRSIVKEISPEYLLEGLMLKLKLQHFGYLI